VTGASEQQWGKYISYYMQVLSQKHVLNLDWGIMERCKGKRVEFMPEDSSWTSKELIFV
jgi:hypothetical protein